MDSEKMTREELIRFLEACLEAEDALYESGKLVQALDEKVREIDRKLYEQPLPNLEGEPKKPDPVKDMRGYRKDSVYRRKEELKNAYLNLELTKISKLRAEVEKAERALDKAEADYLNRDSIEQKRIREYEEKWNSWKEKNDQYQFEIRRQGNYIIGDLVKQKKEQESLRDHFKATLDRLYGSGILYPDFQRVDAIYQIVKYLKMGIVSSLTGPEGAYRIYLEDLRTQKVLDSIEGLRRSVEQGFASVLEGQNAMVRSMVQMQQSLQQMRQEITDHFQGLYDQVVKTGRELAFTIQETSLYEQAILREIHRDQAAIGRIVARSAYNQYLVERKENLDNYLVYLLENPVTY